MGAICLIVRAEEGLRLCNARGGDFHPAEARPVFASAVEEAGLSVEVGNGELHRIEPYADVLILERLLDDLDDVVAAGRLQLLPEAQRGSRSMSLSMRCERSGSTSRGEGLGDARAYRVDLRTIARP